MNTNTQFPTMRNAIFAMIILAACSLRSNAQSISILTFSGYTFEDKVNFSGGYGRIDDGFQWGLGIETAFTEDKAFAIVYQNLATRASLHGTLISESANLGMHYIMGSATHYQPVGAGMVSAFASVDVGACIMSPKDRNDLNNVTRFAWGLRLGVGGGEALKFRIYGQLYSPVQSAGGGFYFGTGGSGVGVTTYSTLYQFGVGASLSYRIADLGN